MSRRRDIWSWLSGYRARKGTQCPFWVFGRRRRHSPGWASGAGTLLGQNGHGVRNASHATLLASGGQLVKCVEFDAFQLGKPLDVEGSWPRVGLPQTFRRRNVWSWHELMPRLEKRHTVVFGCLAGGQHGHSPAATPKRTLSPKCVEFDAFHSGKCCGFATIVAAWHGLPLVQPIPPGAHRSPQ